MDLARELNLRRIALALIVVLPAFALLASVLLLLPSWLAIGCAFVGLVLFQVGGELGWRWSTVVGGVCMFSGVFAAALSGAIGPRAM